MSGKFDLRSGRFDRAEITTDAFFDGALMIQQDRFGYRFSVDSVILAGHVRPKPGDRIIDLGTGCGVIPLLLAFRNPDVRIYGVEVQKVMAELASRNVILNRMEEQIEIVQKDLKSLAEEVAPPVDVVVCNPPYRSVDSGRVNPNGQRAVARHEIMATLSDFLSAAQRVLKRSGRLIVIYPADRAVDLISRMRAFHIEPKWLRTVHSFENAPARLILVRGVKGAGPELNIAPPLFIYETDGGYTDEINAMFNVRD